MMTKIISLRSRLAEEAAAETFKLSARMRNERAVVSAEHVSNLAFSSATDIKHFDRFASGAHFIKLQVER